MCARLTIVSTSQVPFAARLALFRSFKPGHATAYTVQYIHLFLIFVVRSGQEGRGQVRPGPGRGGRSRRNGLSQKLNSPVGTHLVLPSRNQSLVVCVAENMPIGWGAQALLPGRKGPRDWSDPSIPL